ncbi:tetratricopeptide repeat protein [Thermopirellula anaerolimosa]
MKRERRHELQDNLLARWLAEATEKAAPYARAVSLAVLLIVLVVAAWYVFSQRSRSSREAAWGALYQAMQKGTASDLEAVAEQYAGSEAAMWAQVAAADIHLEIGCAQLFSNKADAVQELQKAIDGYLAVRDKVRRPELKERLLWGLARAYESLAGSRQGQGELERAVKLYRELAESFPDGRFATLAQRRAAELERQDVQGFYDFFARYEPSPSPPSGFSPGDLPFDPSALPPPPAAGSTPAVSPGASESEPQGAAPQETPGESTAAPATPIIQPPMSEPEKPADTPAVPANSDSPNGGTGDSSNP